MRITRHRLSDRMGRWTMVLGLAAVALAAAGVLKDGALFAQAQTGTVAIDSDDIGGVVTGSKGPEAGVWVIAETDDLGTKYRKMVVTDDQGRYVLPDLPNANYTVWVRGYGLVDSPKVMSRRGRQLNLRATIAPDAKAAAQYYPASYWLSLMKVPPPSAFPIGDVQSQAQYAAGAKTSGPRQLGTKMTREIPPELAALGFKTTTEALQYAATAGQMTDLGATGPNLERMVDWFDRIAAGETPQQPPRPEGIERNVVVTLWDAANQVPFLHDVVSADKRNPTVNANGKVYGVEFHNDGLVIVDPVEHTDRVVTIPAQIDKTKMRTFTRQTMENPSLFWGDEIIVRDHSNPNHLTMDGRGRVWIAAAVNVTETPAYCRQGSTNKWAMAQPLDVSNRHIAMFDPRTERFSLLHTCIRTHHVQMAVDGTNRVFSNPLGMPMVYFGWIDIDVYDKTQSAEAAQGWCRLFYDVNGDGRGDRDHPVPGSAPYSVIQNPVDGSLWGSQTAHPGRLVRLSLGANPPETCVGEGYEVPFDPTVGGRTNPPSGFGPRGIDVDSTGVIWTALAGTGHLASFDRRLCKTLTGDAITRGRHCDEGWKFYPTPGPRMQGVVSEVSTDHHYYNFVDQHDGFGMGKDTPFANGTSSDAILALDKRTGKVVSFRVPYPISFYTRGMDVRIDNPNTGWKGRGLWAGNGTRNIWHLETGKGTRTNVAQFQLRPSPLAK